MCAPLSSSVREILARYLPLRSLIFVAYLPLVFVVVVLTFFQPERAFRWIVTFTPDVHPAGAGPSTVTAPTAFRCLLRRRPTVRSWASGSVGGSVGSGLGVAVGLAEALGDGDGDPDGLTEGEGDGETEGLADGDAEGDAEALAVGEAVGVGVEHVAGTCPKRQVGDGEGEGDAEAEGVADGVAEGVLLAGCASTVNVVGLQSSPRPRPVHWIT